MLDQSHQGFLTFLGIIYSPLGESDLNFLGAGNVVGTTKVVTAPILLAKTNFAA
jgi:hypothetical protein